MVGGGEGAFIGAVHRIAARLDDHYELVAGALAVGPDEGAALGARARPRRRAHLRRLRGDGEGREPRAPTASRRSRSSRRTTCTRRSPRPFSKAGIHVICDKPLATTRARRAPPAGAGGASTSGIFAVTYNYTGYPMVRQARQMVREGRLGEIRVVQVEYAQDWLTEPLEATRPEAGRLAHRPGARGRRRLHRRHRHPRLPAGRLRHRARVERAVRRPEHASSPAAASTTTRR